MSRRVPYHAGDPPTAGGVALEPLAADLAIRPDADVPVAAVAARLGDLARVDRGGRFLRARPIDLERVQTALLAAGWSVRLGFDPAPPLDLSSRPFRLLQSFLTLLNEELDEPTMARLNGDYILDLIALALNARGEAEAVARGRGLPAARHRLIVAEIERGFADAALSGKMVAARLGITERYLQQLMEQRGETFSHHVLRVRLERAAAMLTTKKHMPVAEVAFRCGFNDLSYFNRTFRRRFGDSPRAYRK